MASNTRNVKLGVCKVFYDGVDLGFTKGGVEVEVATSTHDVTVDQLGETPIAQLITGRTITVSCPLAETTLENMTTIMPGSVLISNGVKATGSVTLKTAVPVTGDTIKIDTHVFAFKTVPATVFDVAIGATFTEAAVNLAAAINAAVINYTAVAAAGVVTITAKITGPEYNKVITPTLATPANATKVDMTGGVASTKAKVEVSSGVNINLLDTAKELRLRPVGTSGEDDLLIYRAGTPGAMQFAYQYDNERIFQANFTGFATDEGKLFELGDNTAV